MNQPVITRRVDQVASLMLPTLGRPLLLPNVSVAEIVGFMEPEPAEHGEPWVLGHVRWREQRIPVVSLELMKGETLPDYQPEQRLAVINSITGKLPFYALLIQGIPRLVRVHNEDISDEPGAVATGEIMNVVVGGELAVIPDLEYIENHLAE